SVAARPDVGVASPARLAIRLRVLEARVDERDVAGELDVHVGGAQVRGAGGLLEPRQKPRLVHERAVRIGGHVVGGQVRIVPGHVGLLRGEEVAAVQGFERLDDLRIVSHDGILPATLARRKGQFFLSFAPTRAPAAVRSAARRVRAGWRRAAARHTSVTGSAGIFAGSLTTRSDGASASARAGTSPMPSPPETYESSSDTLGTSMV